MQEYGLLRCGRAALEKLPSGCVIFTRQNAFGCESLIRDRLTVQRLLPEAVIDPAGIDGHHALLQREGCTMKGLLYKDWTMIFGGYKTNFLFLLLFYGVFTVLCRISFSQLRPGLCAGDVRLLHHQHGRKQPLGRLRPHSARHPRPAGVRQILPDPAADSGQHSAGLPDDAAHPRPEARPAGNHHRHVLRRGGHPALPLPS